MWWRLALLAVVTGALLLSFFAPAQTVSIKVDLPAGAATPSAEQMAQVEDGAKATAYVITGLLVALILLTAGWLARWIVRRYRPRS